METLPQSVSASPMREQDYYEEGVVAVAIQSTVQLVVGVGAVILIMIMIGTLGGSMYNATQSNINAINDTTIKGYVTSSISSSFQALSQTATYIPIIVLASITFLVLFLVVAGSSGLVGYGGQFYGGGMSRTAL